MKEINNESMSVNSLSKYLEDKLSSIENDSDLIKNGVSAVATLVEALNALIDTFGVLPTIGAGVGIAKLISSVGGAKLIALINAPTYVPVVTRSELAA